MKQYLIICTFIIAFLGQYDISYSNEYKCNFLETEILK